jgi:acyl CoA:acetate/3-ketoacid CoA transferase alpha subunit
MQTICPERAVAMFPDGASLMVGGSMTVSAPVRLIDEIVRQGKRDLTVIAKDMTQPGRGIDKLAATELAAITFADSKATLAGMARGVTVAQVIAANGAEPIVPDRVPELPT